MTLTALRYAALAGVVAFASPPAGHEAPPKAPPAAPAHAAPHAAPPSAPPSAGHDAAPTIAPGEALTRLQAGHARFLSQEALGPRRDLGRVHETFAGQHPFAAVLSCADSRVPPEILFDQGFGDLFVVRVAGNVAGADELGSLEYAVDHLGVRLIVVLGHTKCGAVTAACAGGHAPGSVPAILRQIQPAVVRARQGHPGVGQPELVAHTISENVWVAVESTLVRSDGIAGAVAKGQVRVVGAIYDLEGGALQWMGTHPRQGQFASRIRLHGEPNPSRVGVAATGGEADAHGHP